jgi:hypothetical protein
MPPEATRSVPVAFAPPTVKCGTPGPPFWVRVASPPITCSVPSAPAPLPTSVLHPDSSVPDWSRAVTTWPAPFPTVSWVAMSCGWLHCTYTVPCR